MDSVEVHKLSPHPFLWFGLCKNSFKKVVLLDINLGALSYCKKQRDGSIRTVIKVLKKTIKHICNVMDIYILDGSNIPQVLSTGIKSVSPR